MKIFLEVASTTDKLYNAVDKIRHGHPISHESAQLVADVILMEAIIMEAIENEQGESPAPLTLALVKQLLSE